QAALARTTGVRMRGVLLEGNWYANDGGPLLGFVMEENDVLAPVALLPSRRGYRVHNPKSGEAVPVTREVVNGLHPQAYQFYPPFPNKPLAPFDVLRFSSKRSVRDMVFAIFIGMATGSTGMLIPLLTGWVFDRIVPGAERGLLTELT